MAKITMGGLLTPARVIPRLKAHDKAQVIRELARSASHSACVEESVVHEATKICANSPSFGPGRRVAIPHAVVKGIDNALGIFARLQPAMAFGAVDGEPVDRYCWCWRQKAARDCFFAPWRAGRVACAIARCANA